LIRNLLYSLSLHLLIILIVYLNFNFQDFVEIPSNQPITVSFVALKEDNLPKINDEDDAEKIESKTVEPNLAVKKKEVEKSKKQIKKEKKKTSKKKTKKKKSHKKSANNSTKDSKKRALKAKQESKNVEKIQTINLSVRERFNFELQIKRCYKKAINQTSNISTIPIKVNVKVKNDGSVNINSLKILNKQDYTNSKNDLNIALNNAKIALKLCSPLRNLPKDKYEIWQEIELLFDGG